MKKPYSHQQELTPFLVVDSKCLTEFLYIVKILVKSKKFFVLIPEAGKFFKINHCDKVDNLFISSPFRFGRAEEVEWGRPKCHQVFGGRIPERKSIFEIPTQHGDFAVAIQVEGSQKAWWVYIYLLFSI